MKFNATSVILVINIISFLLYGIDKILAKKKKYRIPESFLIFLAFVFGGVGAVFGMIVFNHKTSKMKFRIVVPLAVCVNYLFWRDSFAILESFLNYVLQIIRE